MRTKTINRAFFYTLCLLYLLRTVPALAIAAAPGDTFHFRLVEPVGNQTDFQVWSNRYYPGDILPEKMTDYFLRKLKNTPAVSASLIRHRDTLAWRSQGFSKEDAIIKLSLERFDHTKKDSLGSRLHWNVGVRMVVFNGATQEPIFDSVIRNKNSKLYLLYTDVLENTPVYWEQFTKTDYWKAIRSTLDTAYDELVTGYTGYRIVGQIVAKAERVDGSLSVPKKLKDRLYHVTVGRNHTLRVGDTLIITRASAVRTVDPDHRELHFPQVIGRAQVYFLKDSDAVIRITKESGDAPVQIGDAVSLPLAGTRNQPLF